MKEQYIGDIGDYGKYGLLRFLKDSGVSIGVNWYLTPYDGSSDGNRKEYLDVDTMRTYDDDVYIALRPIADREDKTIHMIESLDILRGIRFFNKLMDFDTVPWRDRQSARQEWHRRAKKYLAGTEFIFADPDNGLLPERKKLSSKGAQKYIFAEEIIDYYTSGSQVMYYHHRSRRPIDEYLADLRRIEKLIPGSRLIVLTFHRWSCRSYVFVIHDDQYIRYKEIIDRFLRSRWGTYKIGGNPAFTEEIIYS